MLAWTICPRARGQETDRSTRMRVCVSKFVYRGLESSALHCHGCLKLLKWLPMDLLHEFSHTLRIWAMRQTYSTPSLQ